MQTKSAPYRHLAGITLGITLAVSVVVLLIGYIYHWDEPVRFSNAFFITGLILIILGGLTVASGFSQRAYLGMIHAESAGQSDLEEGSRQSTSGNLQKYGVMFALLIPGLILIGIAVVIGKFLVQ